MMFAEYVVLCCEEKTDLEKDLERWRAGLENRGMKVSRVDRVYVPERSVQRKRTDATLSAARSKAIEVP